MHKFTRSSYFWNHSSELDTLVNQNSHAAPIRSLVRGRTDFSKLRGLRASVTFFPLPHPLLPPFCSRPIFRAAQMQKPLSLGPNFVRIVRERLLRRLGLPQKKSSLYRPLRAYRARSHRALRHSHRSLHHAVSFQSCLIVPNVPYRSYHALSLLSCLIVPFLKPFL